MSKETRIGLVVGLLFIIMFGLVLGGMLNPKTPTDNSPPAGGVAMVANGSGGGEGDREYGYIPTTPAMDPERHPTPAAVPARPVSDGAATTEPATATGAGGGTVVVSLPRADSEPMPGEVHGISVPAPGRWMTGLRRRPGRMACARNISMALARKGSRSSCPPEFTARTWFQARARP